MPDETAREQIPERSTPSRTAQSTVLPLTPIGGPFQLDQAPLSKLNAAPEAAIPDYWYNTVMADIATSEYHINYQEQAGAYQSPNRKQDLRITYHAAGFELKPRVADSTWKVALELDRIGREEQWFLPNDSAILSSEGPTLLADHGAFTIDYHNGEEGMRQNFVVRERPLGDGPLEVRLNYTGTLHAADKGGNAIAFCTPASNGTSYTPTVWYKDLHVWDADGDTLEATATLDGGTILLAVNDENASYPITVDPLSSTAAWTAESDQADANWGTSLAGIGDLNNDGFDEVVIGCRSWDEVVPNRGRISLYYGSSTGLDVNPSVTFMPPPIAGSLFGRAVASAGDVNGDGIGDVIVGAEGLSNGQANEGRVYVLLGSSSALTWSWQMEGNQVSAFFGSSVSSAGDVNDDGYDDIIIGARGYSNGQAGEGRAYVYAGSATGPGATPLWTAEINQAGASYGHSVTGLADANGDGYDEVAVGAYFMDGAFTDAGATYVYYGSAGGPALTASWTRSGSQTDGYFGIDVDDAGDVNSDGFGDLIVGANGEDVVFTDEGAAYLYLGSATGLAATPAWSASAGQGNSTFGFSVAGIGDFDGDGYDDVAVGAYMYDGPEFNEGRVELFRGSATGLGAQAWWSAEANQASAYFCVVEKAGDTNGDGYADLLVGAWAFSNGQAQEGRSYLFLGMPSSPTTISNVPDWDVGSGSAAAPIGSVVRSAGDFNGDGRSDVIIGVPMFDGGFADQGSAFLYISSPTGLNPAPAVWWAFGGQANARFGSDVNTAGDVSGDGLSDILISAPLHDNGQTDEGRVYLYLGSTTIAGSNIPAWTAEVNQTTAQFGSSIASAGDVNADGFSDVLIGAPGYSNGQPGEGRAYVYHGMSTGLNATPAWITEINQVGAAYGGCVASAGDLNADGYSDVIVSAAQYDGAFLQEGAVYVYLGSASGVSTALHAQRTGNQDFAYFGRSVSSAGDTNGDGYSDVLIGAPFFDVGQQNEGTVFLYRGTPSGLAVGASWSAQGNERDAHLGISVACAGDIDADGFSDVLLGAPDMDDSHVDAGQVRLYKGSAAGLSAQPYLRLNGPDSGSDWGASVASAGDVNGDGYSDIVIGAPGSDQWATNAGQVCLFHGRAAEASWVANWSAQSGQSLSYYGINVSAAGNVNGDAYSDALVTAPRFDNGLTDAGRVFVYHGTATGLNATAPWFADGDQAGCQFGSSAACAGDVNGDGYSDVLIGALRYDNGHTDEGRAYIYHGGGAGLGAIASWWAESNQANAWFGEAVSTAGDVNGDGYSDVIIGAPEFDNGQSNEGRAFVFLGSASGLVASPNWTAENNQAGSRFGLPVSSAGDTNGDGYSDVLVGAPYFDNGQTDEGRVSMFYGGPLGLSPLANWSSEGDQVQAYFGMALGAAGDVNGDGFSDIIIGAEGWNNGLLDVGAAFVFHGSAGGLSATPDWSVEGDDDFDYLGNSVASVGDANGDGYSDVVVGARWFGTTYVFGAAFVYQGGPGGLATSIRTELHSTQQGAELGMSVSGVGDVNGDGYSDVIAGAYLHDGTLTDEGSAFAYYGNNGTGRRHNLRLYNSNLTAPISQSNVAIPFFGAGLYAKPFLGRGRVRMVWETRIQGQAFSSAGGSITHSTAITAYQAAATQTALAGTELKSLVNKLTSTYPITATKVRARLRYNMATAITGQVFGPWRYMPGYLDGGGTHNNIPLPVEMLWMEAACEHGTPTITWATASELNNSHYAIERSADAEYWEEVGRVDGAGNTQQTTEYAWRDEEPLAASTVYYRLRQVDLDGREELLAVLPVDACDTNGITLTVVPNPTDGPVEVLWSTENGSNSITVLQLLDARGSVLQRLRVADATGSRWAMDLSALAAGTYLLIAVDDDGVQVASARVVRR